MKQKIKIVKNLQEYLKIVIKPILNTPGSLKTNKKIKGINLNPREVLGLFLICTVGRFLTNEDWTIASDPEDYDGTIICRSNKREGEGFAVEQVYVSRFQLENLTDHILHAIRDKESKGSEYGKNRHLIVFCDKKGLLDHQIVKNEIENNNIFLSYWIISKMAENEWKYLILSPKTISDPVMAYSVTISNTFEDWIVETLGKI